MIMPYFLRGIDSLAYFGVHPRDWYILGDDASEFIATAFEISEKKRIPFPKIKLKKDILLYFFRN